MDWLLSWKKDTSIYGNAQFRREEITRRQGSDPQRYRPAVMGAVRGSISFFNTRPGIWSAPQIPRSSDATTEPMRSLMRECCEKNGSKSRFTQPLIQDEAASK